MEKLVDTIINNMAVTNIIFVLEESDAKSIKELSKKSKMDYDYCLDYVRQLEDTGFIETFTIKNSHAKGVRLSKLGRELATHCLSIIKLEQQLIKVTREGKK